MNGSRQAKWFARVTATAAAALVLAGCGTTPMGPTAPPPEGSAAPAPPILSVASDGAFEYVAAPTADALLARGRDGGGGGTVPNKSLSSTGVIDGAAGGTLTCGRFVVTVPPGAYTGAGTVTMSMDDSTLAVVDLSISPKKLNGFAVPVELSYNPRGLALTSPVTIFWLDFKTWVDIGADPQPGTGLPTTDLQHFSKYAAGKAGW